MKKLWSFICVVLAWIWILPITMIPFGELVPARNISETNLLYTFWFQPAEAARQNDMMGYLPSLVWIALIWVVGMILIWRIQRIKRKCSK